jgi:hypothetical protein
MVALVVVLLVKVAHTVLLEELVFLDLQDKVITVEMEILLDRVAVVVLVPLVLHPQVQEMLVMEVMDKHLAYLEVL